jgi:YVTN family beta-propeller protein
MKYYSLCLLVLLSGTVFAQKTHEYKVINTWHINSPGGWDYISVNNGKVYVSHGTQVNILDATTGDSLGYFPNTNGVHGIAFDNSGHAYTSNGRDNSVSVFDLNTNKLLGTVNTGQNPDAILFDPHTGSVITCNGRSRDLSIIDPQTKAIINTVDVGGKPETAISDGEGKLFVNIEDKNEIAVVDLGTHQVINRWSLAGAEGPTGLAYDRKNKRLFAGCEKTLVVMNAENGSIINKIPIGNGCDGVAFNPATHIVYTSNGEGSINVIEETGKDQFIPLGNYPTRRGARTIALDEKTGTLYLPTAEFESTPGANGRPKMIPGSFQVLVVR